MIMSKDLILNRILEKGLNDKLVVCSCNGIKIYDVKKTISNLKFNEFKNFDHFAETLDCGDVCEYCIAKSNAGIKADISLEEIYYS